MDKNSEINTAGCLMVKFCNLDLATDSLRDFFLLHVDRFIQLITGSGVVLASTIIKNHHVIVDKSITGQPEQGELQAVNTVPASFIDMETALPFFQVSQQAFSSFLMQIIHQGSINLEFIQPFILPSSQYYPEKLKITVDPLRPRILPEPSLGQIDFDSEIILDWFLSQDVLNIEKLSRCDFCRKFFFGENKGSKFCSKDCARKLRLENKKKDPEEYDKIKLQWRISQKNSRSKKVSRKNIKKSYLTNSRQ
jgi:hypothetical protein